MIEAHGLTRRYGAKTAVDDVTFTVQPGKVTGFLGPNGAGKSTTMRLIVGLDHPTRGTVTVNGWRYDQHRAPWRGAGPSPRPRGGPPGPRPTHPRPRGAATHGIGRPRGGEVIEMTGLEP